MKTKVCKVILTFVLVVGFSLSLLNGEQHLWKFNETSGDIAYDSLGTVNGTLHGCATFFRCGNSVYLDGVNESYVSFGTTVGQFGTNDFTVYLEFKTSDKKEIEIVGNRLNPNDAYFDIIMDHNGNVIAELTGAGRTNSLKARSSQTGLNDGNKHNLVAMRIGKNLNLYIDDKQGSPSETSKEKADITNSNEFRLGLLSTDFQMSPPSGFYCNLCVVDIAMQPNEIEALLKKNKR